MLVVPLLLQALAGPLLLALLLVELVPVLWSPPAVQDGSLLTLHLSQWHRFQQQVLRHLLLVWLLLALWLLLAPLLFRQQAGRCPALLLLLLVLLQTAAEPQPQTAWESPAQPMQRQLQPSCSQC